MSWFDDNPPPAGSPTSQVMPTTAPGAPPMAAGASGGAGTTMPQFTAGMTDDQVRQMAMQYITAAGGSDPNQAQYWVDQYHQYGVSDPGYFQTKLLNGIQSTGGNMTAFGPPSATAPGGYGPGTSGAAGGGAGGAGGYTPGKGANPYGTMAGSPDAFVAPTAADMMANDPGYQARLQTGEQAVQGSAAAKGSVLSGGTLKALNDYSQQFASNEYGNYFNQALQGYTTNTGTQRNAMNDYYSRLQGLYGTGQTATAGTGAPAPTQ